MANKRFYWLKLKEDFFQQKAMKKLRRMDRGETLTIIYLKMQLASLRNGGVIAFEGLGDSFAEELSLQLDELENDVRITVEFLTKCGLMEQIDGADTYILPGAIENTGSESDSAARMRALRGRSSSQCDGKTSQSNVASQCDGRDREKKEEKRDQRKERERDEAAEPPTPARDDNGLILLSDADYNQLCEELGESELSRVILYLSGYCRLHGKSYPDWPFAIRKASKEGWGKPAPGKGTAPTTDFQPSADRIKENNDWLDSFLAEQQKKEGGGKWDNLPGVTRL